MIQNRIPRHDTRLAREALAWFPTKSGAYAYVEGLSSPSKMAPVKSYGLHTDACGACPFKAAGSPIGCYARNSERMYPNTDAANHAHVRAIRKPRWEAAMTRAIDDHAEFRWHWSGDVQDIRHFLAIVHIAQALPRTMFWLPAAEKALDALEIYLTSGRTLPENLAVPLSDHGVKNAPRSRAYKLAVKFSLPWSFVIAKNAPAPTFEHHVCPATVTGNPHTCKANGCDICYKRVRSLPVGYIEHR